MTKKRPVILGPDGKPYVAPPKVEPKVTVAGVDLSASVKDISVTIDGGSLIPTSFYESWLSATRKPKAPPAERPLARAVAEQIGTLTADFDGAGGEELPRPPVDLHTYADALASAKAKCKHPYPEDTIHSRGEFYCRRLRPLFRPRRIPPDPRGHGRVVPAMTREPWASVLFNGLMLLVLAVIFIAWTSVR